METGSFAALPMPSPLGGKTPPLRGRWHEVPEGEQVDATVGSRRMRVCLLSAAPPLPQEAGAADAVPGHDPACENGIPERPQTLRYSEI